MELNLTQGHIDLGLYHKALGPKFYKPSLHCPVAIALTEFFPNTRPSVGGFTAELYDKETFSLVASFILDIDTANFIVDFDTKGRISRPTTINLKEEVVPILMERKINVSL